MEARSAEMSVGVPNKRKNKSDYLKNDQNEEARSADEFGSFLNYRQLNALEYEISIR